MGFAILCSVRNTLPNKSCTSSESWAVLGSGGSRQLSTTLRVLVSARSMSPSARGDVVPPAATGCSVGFLRVERPRELPFVPFFGLSTIPVLQIRPAVQTRTCSSRSLPAFEKASTSAAFARGCSPIIRELLVRPRASNSSWGRRKKTTSGAETLHSQHSRSSVDASFSSLYNFCLVTPLDPESSRHHHIFPKRREETSFEISNTTRGGWKVPVAVCFSQLLTTSLCTRRLCSRYASIQTIANIPAQLQIAITDRIPVNGVSSARVAPMEPTSIAPQSVAHSPVALRQSSLTVKNKTIDAPTPGSTTFQNESGQTSSIARAPVRRVATRRINGVLAPSSKCTENMSTIIANINTARSPSVLAESQTPFAMTHSPSNNPWHNPITCSIISPPSTSPILLPFF
eukprot:Hpha_TRINITY_DN16412_c0_g5::TRINITY_DN16412_c0_g5_i2::g.158897::m.158897